MIKPLIILLFLLPFCTFGQDIEVRKYFLNEDRELCDSISATYIFIISQKKGDVAASAKIFSKEGILISEMGYSDFTRRIRHGVYKDYDENGKLRLKSFYKNDRLDGEFTTYYPDGTLKRKDIYQNDTLLFGRCYIAQKKDTTYYNYSIPAEYLDGGINGFRKFVAINLQYPKEAKRKEITGIVIISFIIGKDGITRDFKVQKSVHPLLDAEALRVVRLTGKWKPGYMDGKLLDLKKRIPITFHLDASKTQEISIENERGLESDSSTLILKRKIITGIEYPKLAKRKGTQGIVVLSFEIDENGRITGSKIKKDIGDGCGEAALAALKKLENDHIMQPTSIDGKYVKTRKEISIVFHLVELPKKRLSNSNQQTTQPQKRNYEQLYRR